MRAYVLLVAKQGPKLKASAGGEESLTWREGRVAARAVSLEEFANQLSGPLFKLERPVVDETGIVGVFDFTVEWTPDGVTCSESLREIDGAPAWRR